MWDCEIFPYFDFVTNGGTRVISKTQVEFKVKILEVVDKFEFESGS